MILPLRTNHFMERAGLYGDLLFETMFWDQDGIRHPELHFERLSLGLNRLKMPKPHLTFSSFLEKSLAAIDFGSNQNPEALAFRIRFIARRDGTGNYLPDQAQLNYEAIAQPILHKNNKVLTLGIYPDQAKAPGELANLKTGNALIYVMSALYAQENNWDECLILNTNGSLIESSTSNIFWQKNQQWFTPPLTDGCIAGIARKVFMNSNQVIEKSCKLVDLQSADQRILTNALYLQREFILNP